MDDQWPHQTRDTSRLLERVRSEYLEMPGLTLTAAQARRLWNMDEPICGQLLLALLESDPALSLNLIKGLVERVRLAGEQHQQ